jgi:hypothetical protein
MPGGRPCLRQGFGRQALTMEIQGVTDKDHGYVIFLVESVHKYQLNKNCHSGPGFHRDKLQPECSRFKTFWMPPYQSTGQAPQVRHDGKGAFMNRLQIMITGKDSSGNVSQPFGSPA